MLKEYAFDVQLMGAVRVRAQNVEQARYYVIDRLSCANANLGAWPDGQPILSEVGLFDEAPLRCYEVDGDPAHPDCD